MDGALQMGLVEVDRESGTSRVLVPETAQPPPDIFQLSPSGKWISYLSAQITRTSDGRITRQLALVPRTGGFPTLVTNELDLPDWDYNTRNYIWHPRKDLLIFVLMADYGFLDRV